MKRKTRNILLILVCVALFFCSLAGYGIYSVYKFLKPAFVSKEIPKEIAEPRVTTGQGWLTRTEFFKLDRQSYLDTFREAGGIEDEKERQRTVNSQTAKGLFNFSHISVIGNDVIAVGKFGGYVLDHSGSLRRHISFEPSTERIKIGPYEQDTYQANVDNLRVVPLTRENYGFLSWGSVQGVRIFNQDGDQIWTAGKEQVDLSIVLDGKEEREKKYDASTHVLEAAVGDLDNDGVSEFVVARKKDGIRVFDQSGNEKWFQPDEFPSEDLLIYDVDGDGTNELIEKGKQIRDGSGKILREMKGSSYDACVFVTDKEKRSKVNYLDFSQGKMEYSGEDGTTLFEVDAPLSDIKKAPERIDVPGDPEMSFTDETESVAFPKAVRVKLDGSGKRYLAVVAAFIGIPRANFYIFDEAGKLIYHELLPEDAETLTVLPAADGFDQILVGGSETIWKYSLR